MKSAVLFIKEAKFKDYERDEEGFEKIMNFLSLVRRNKKQILLLENNEEVTHIKTDCGIRLEANTDDMYKNIVEKYVPHLDNKIKIILTNKMKGMPIMNATKFCKKLTSSLVNRFGGVEEMVKRL